jgi:hypothetical protein
MGQTKKDMRSALGATLKAEEHAVRSRFEKAESVFAVRYSSAKDAKQAKAASKVVRDSFTMLEQDYDLIPALKDRCLKLGINVNKSQVLRAGLNALDQLSNEKLVEIIHSLAEVKPGRPAV